MSLVGTRPPTLDEWEQYKPHHRARMAFRPGLTGMWQVSGRSNITDFEEVVKLDTEYINEWSLRLDLKILYYGITDNTERITAFRYHVMKSLFYCLNRRSQKKSYNWVEFLNMIDNSYPLVRPRIYDQVWQINNCFEEALSLKPEAWIGEPGSQEQGNQDLWDKSHYPHDHCVFKINPDIATLKELCIIGKSHKIRSYLR